MKMRAVWLRIIIFLIALTAWYVVAIFSFAPGSHENQAISTWADYLVPYVVFFGSLFAIPTVVIAAVADRLANVFFPRLPTLAFLILVALGVGAGLTFMQYGLDVDLRTNFNQFLIYPGPSTAVVVAIYTIVNVVPELSALLRR